ncbi:hypothetical protein [Streptomyces sp. NPDC058861]|uniref:hypothetical protein n=1 Tax=Streptomyces sp. NPDC058861 TaxID=3346653 RepID=UPI0036AC664B
MPTPLARLATHPTTGTAHYGVVLPDSALTVCATGSPDFDIVADLLTSHSSCRACERGLLALTTPAHPGNSLDLLPALGTGKGAVGHQLIPGHLLGHCGKALDLRKTASKRTCRPCEKQVAILQNFKERAGGLLLPDNSPCHDGEDLLWAPFGQGNLVVGHLRNAATAKGFCDAPLSVPNPVAVTTCTPCRRRRQQVDTDHRALTLPRMRQHVGKLFHGPSAALDDRAGELRPGDAYALSGCPDTHLVVATTEVDGDPSIDVLVYLRAEDCLADLRIHRDRLVAIQRSARQPQ